MYPITDKEKERLTKGIRAAFAIPFVPDVADFIWEGVFSDVKGVPLIDTIANIRSKRLFDVVDQTRAIGWSAKTVTMTPARGKSFWAVIQRADVLTKSAGSLTPTSSEKELGDAVWTHWYDQKVTLDSGLQNVKDARTCILVKSRNRTQYAYIEEAIKRYPKKDLVWSWGKDAGVGLQGFSQTEGRPVFRWYPHQTQLFESFVIPEDAYLFTLTPRRLPLSQMIDYLVLGLDNNP